MLLAWPVRSAGAGVWVMLSVLSYGRLVARAVIGGLSQTDGRDYSLVTASCGFGKDFRKGILKKGMCYGDDACFIARHRSADVLGECPFETSPGQTVFDVEWEVKGQPDLTAGILHYESHALY